MKKINYIILGGVLTLGLLASCSDFVDVNTNPKAASEIQIKPFYAFDKAIIHPQMSPHEAERIFVYAWKTSARQHNMTFTAAGGYSDDFNDDYHNNRITEWIKSASLSEKLCKTNLKSGNLSEKETKFTSNLLEVSRIWKTYLISEYVDNFGVYPIDAFKGVNPEFKSCQDTYNYMLDELKDALSKIDITVIPTSDQKNYDPAYKFNFAKWSKYGYSLMMRLAMRIADVEPSKAKEFYELAADKSLITIADDVFQVEEKGGWDALTGVMTRSWNTQNLSETMYNLMVGLGGVKSSDQLTDDRYTSYFKAENYLGLYIPEHTSDYTDDPYKHFFMDGIPYSVDPRAFKLFYLPSDKNASNYWDGLEEDERQYKLYKIDETDNTTVEATITADFCFNGYPQGFNGKALAKNGLYNNYYTNFPALASKYRDSSQKRVWFGHWETYFLLAEGAVRGWSTPMTAQEAYEKGIKASFDYNDCTAFYDFYIKSTSYNNVGTSVLFTHVEEPPVTKSMIYTNAYTGAVGTYDYAYPVASKTMYGKALNDQLSKIITQKYLAQMPYLPLEAWSDFRRLGLPFFEIISSVEPQDNMPEWSKTVYKTGQKSSLYPQRFKFPSSLENADKTAYENALILLGGEDNTLTPLWWAKKK